MLDDVEPVRWSSAMSLLAHRTPLTWSQIYVILGASLAAHDSSAVGRVGAKGDK